MKCFNYSEIDAVAICKSCGRGLCPQCVMEVGPSCSGKDRCEANVASMNELIQR